MKKNTLLSLAFIPFLFLSCEDGTKEEGGSEIMVTTTVTKPESSDIQWSSGVAFTIYSDSQADELAGGRTLFCSDATGGIFKGEIANDKSRTFVSAIYPRQTSGVNNNIAVSVPATQEYGRTGKFEYLVAHENVSGNSIPSINFQSVCCKVIVKVDNLSGTAEKMTGIHMTAKEDIFPISGALSSLEMPQFIALTSEKSLFCDFGKEIEGDAETAFVFFPSACAGKEIEVSVTCASESIYTLKTSFPESFGQAGSVFTCELKLDEITPFKPGDDQPKKWLQVLSIEDLMDGEYIIAAAQAKADGKISLLGNEAVSFTYTESHGDANSTNKSGTGLNAISAADADKWIESASNTWIFKSEGNFDMKAGNTITVPGWSIKNKESEKYLNMDNGQNLVLTETFVANTEIGAPLLKQRWTIEVSEAGEVTIRSIQNSGRYLRYYSTDDTFMLAGLVSNMVNVCLYKLNPDR